MSTEQNNSKRIDIEISNSGSGFYGFHGHTVRGRKWIDRYAHGAFCGVAWCDDRGFAMEIAEAAINAGLGVK